MSLAMTREERETFLADVHVGVLAVAVDGRAALAVPVWYAYEPGGLVSFVTAGGSLKATHLRAAGQASLCVQTEVLPYSYVTVEGPVVEITEVDPDERRHIAHRYLGPELGEQYLASTQDQLTESVTVRIRPERWRTVDYGKQFG